MVKGSGGPLGYLRGRSARRRVGGAQPDEPTVQHLGLWADVDAADLSGHHDAVERIYAGTLDGMTIRNVFDPAVLASGVALLEERYGADLVDYGEQTLYGRALVGADDERSEYFAAAPLVNDRLESLFEGGFTPRVAAVLSEIGGGRPTTVPTEGPGRDYVPATVRFLQPGTGVMHAHTANEFCNVWEAYSYLRSTVRMWNSLSYFVVGEAPADGGELVLYDLMWDDTPEAISDLPMSAARDELLAAYPTKAIAPSAGDMIVFTGGRIWHRVAPVRGDLRRVTIGGFLALSAAGDEILHWS